MFHRCLRKMKKHDGPVPAASEHRAYLIYNAIFDTGCRRLQSCIEMQPTDKLESI